MSQSLLHPAVAVAQERVAALDDEFGTDFAPAAIRIMDNAAAVVMDSTNARFVIVVEDMDGVWTAPSMLTAAPIPEGPRAERTPDLRPLKQMSRKRSGWPVVKGQWPDQCWFAVTGLAALDATEIAVIVEGHEHREPIGADGLAFAIARIRTEQEPTVVVHTHDGRAVTAVH